MIAILIPRSIHEPPGPLPNGDFGWMYYLMILVVALAAGFWAITLLSFALRRRSNETDSA